MTSINASTLKTFIPPQITIETANSSQYIFKVKHLLKMMPKENQIITKMSGPQALWVTWLISMILLLVVGGTLCVAPSFAQQYWPWPLAPFNTRLLGAVYLSAAIPLVGYISRPTVEKLRIVLPVFACFTTYFLLASMGHSSNFLTRKSSPIWFLLYGADSGIGLFYCWRLRRLLLKRDSAPQPFRALYQIQSLILVLYGLGLLLVAPLFGKQLWLWPIDLFHSHLYSGVFFTGALGMWLLSTCSTRRGRIWLGITQTFLGFSVVLGNWLVDLQVQTLDWLSLAPWLWQYLFFLFGCLGGWVVVQEQFLPAKSTASD